jgi:hypothetical protein
MELHLQTPVYLHGVVIEQETALIILIIFVIVLMLTSVISLQLLSQYVNEQRS